MKIELKEKDIAMIERISKITGYDYLSNIDENNCVEADFLLDILSDLETECINLKEQYDNLEITLKTQYVPFIEKEWEYDE